MNKLAGLALGVLGLAGCANIPSHSPAAAMTAMSGSVHGGQQPVSGATIQMFAVGTASDGVGSASPLFSVQTDANGSFNAPSSSYTCPSSAALVYLVATGGNPGLGPGKANPQLALMALLGPCGSVTDSTVVVVNELTTVAAAYALTPYMTSATGVGSTPAHAAALASAFGLASEYVNVGTGAAPGANIPSGYTDPVAQINTIGDVLATCVNSVGGVVNDGSVCGTLFLLTTPPGGTAGTDTVGVLLNLANHPTLNTGLLFNLATPAAPFQPADAIQPPDFSVSLFASASMALAPASGIFFPSTGLGASSVQTATLTNNGPGPMALTSISFNGNNAAEFSQTNNCPGSVAASTSCSIFVTATPTTPGTRTTNMYVATTASNSPSGVVLDVYGIYPSITVLPGGLTFPATTVGTTATAQTAMVTNSGVSLLTLTGISMSGNTADFSQTNNCPATLAANAFCTITATMTPTTTGLRQAAITVSSNALQAPSSYTVSLSGVGAAPVTGSSLVVSTPSLFIAGGQTGYINLTNQGTAPIAISSIAVTGFQATENDTCGTSMAGGASCLVSITSFGGGGNPISTGALVVTNNSSTPQLTVSLSTFPNSSILNFNSVAVGASASAQITAGPGSFVFISGTISGADAADFGGFGQSYSCGTRNGYCSVTLPFTPSAVGSRTAFFTYGYALTGFGLAPGVKTGTTSGSPGTLAFPQTALNASSSTQTITISNPDGHLLDFLSSTADYQVSPAYCSATNCPVSVTFTPKTAQQYANSGTVLVFDSATNQTQQFYLSGYGGMPTLTFTPSPLNFGSVTVGQSSASRTVLVSDTGDSPAFLSFSFPSGGTGSSDFNGYSFTQTVTAGTPYTTYPYQFLPTNLGVRSGSVTVTDSRSGLVVGSYTVTGTGIGALTTTLSASPTSISFPNTVIGVTSALLTVTVTNSGNFTATIGSVSFGGANALDFANTSSCATIAAQGTCTLSVTFTPGATGLRSGLLLISSNDPASPLTVPLSGTGSPIPTVTLSPTSLMFYERGAPQTVTLTNLSANPLSISAFNMVGHYTQTNNCGTVLAGNSSCSIFVSTDQSVGIFTGSMTVVDSDTADVQTVSLSSNVPYGAVLDFGSSAVGVPGSTRTLTGGVVTVFPGQISLIYSFNFAGPNPGEFNGPGSSPGCGNHNGSPCTAYFVFVPQGAGVRYAIATANDGSIYLFKGVGVIPQQTFSLSATSLNFGSLTVGTSRQQQIFVYNTSTPSNTILQLPTQTLSTGVGNSGDFALSNNCGFTQFSCTITITMTPQVAGPRSTVLTLVSGTGYQQTVTITGTGQ